MIASAVRHCLGGVIQRFCSIGHRNVWVFFLGAMIFLIAAMDNPFRGEVSVSSQAFELVYQTMIDESDTGVDE